jgi:hypothetical protein
MIIFKITSSNGKMDSLLEFLHRGKALVREKDGIIYVGTSQKETSWMHKTCAEYSANCVGFPKDEFKKLFPKVGSPRREEGYVAPCGVEVGFEKIAVMNHVKTCLNCKQIRATKPLKAKRKGTPRHSKSEVIIHVAPGQEFTLEGVITSLETSRDQMYKHIESTEAMIAALKGYKMAMEQERVVVKQKDEYLDAARKILNLKKA